MARYTADIEVAASPAEAFVFLSDPCNRAEWDPSVREISPVDGADGSVGDRYALTVGFYGKGIDATYEIAELEAPGRIVFTASGKAEGRDEIEIEARPGGAVVHLDMEVKLKGLARMLDRGLGVAFSGIGENAAAGIRKRLG